MLYTRLIFSLWCLIMYILIQGWMFEAYNLLETLMPSKIARGTKKTFFQSCTKKKHFSDAVGPETEMKYLKSVCSCSFKNKTTSKRFQAPELEYYPLNLPSFKKKLKKRFICR